MPSAATSTWERSENLGKSPKVDTSFLCRDWINKYEQTGEAVHVDFRKITPWIKLGDQNTHHLHPYPGKILPNIAGFFLGASSIVPRNCSVLDPFCGSGTIALEASLAGFNPLIADVNPLALLIASVKTNPYNELLLLDRLRNISRKYKKIRSATEIDVINWELWYTPKRKRELEKILRCIREVDDRYERDFFLVCFSVLARKLSKADPAISVPVILKEKDSLSAEANAAVRRHIWWVRTVDAVSEFEKICLENIERIREANRTNPRRLRAESVSTDAKQLRVGVQQLHAQVPLIITSPPYGSAQKYIRASSLSLNWLGLATPDELKKFEQMSIGREHVSKKYHSKDELPLEFEQKISEIEKVNKIRAIISRAYLTEMKAALDDMYKVLAPGGYLILVLGNNVVSGHIIENDSFVFQHLQGKGAMPKLKLTDNIKTRALMRKRNVTASLMNQESILMLQKPAELPL